MRIAMGAALLLLAAPALAAARADYPSPEAVVVGPRGARAFVLDAGADRVLEVAIDRGEVVREHSLAGRPNAGALSPDGETLWVSLQHGEAVVALKVATLSETARIRVSPEPRGLALSPDGRRLFVTSGLEDQVTAFDLPAQTEAWRARVGRAPRGIAITPDGEAVIVANGKGRSVSILSAADGAVRETRPLGVASLLRGVAVSADGRFAIVAHTLSRDRLTTMQMERGFIHANGFSVLDLSRPAHRVTLLLDRLLAGAANPNAVAIRADGEQLAISLSGVHQIALLDLPGVLRLVASTRPEAVRRRAMDVELLDRSGLMRRVASGGEGPRGIAYRGRGHELLVANAFEGGLVRLDSHSGGVLARTLFGGGAPDDLWRRGQRLFNDARLGFQTWFSCVSCHGEDAGVDGLNWDLPNDGVGNFKNAKSLRDVHDTAPAMWRGVRADLDAAARAGQRFEGFLPDPAQHAAIVAFLSDPPRPPNPYRARLADAAARGKRVFARALCSTCHPAPTFTDQRRHDLGLRGPDDLASRFDTPSLRECYRTGPFLHDGSAQSLEAIFLRRDPAGLHGRTRDLSAAELADLVAYLKTL